MYTVRPCLTRPVFQHERAILLRLLRCLQDHACSNSILHTSVALFLPGPNLNTCFGVHNRWDKMATLEFDRNRKSMSVIACAPQPSSSTASGVTTRSSARNNSGSSNVLFVKGAAEYMLNRCSKVQASSIDCKLSHIFFQSSAFHVTLSCIRLCK